MYGPFLFIFLTTTIMYLQKAERRKAKIKLALQGPSGSGKTYSSLLVAFGLCGDWSKIAIVDSESESSNLYAHLGAFNVVSLQAPFSPERYIEAINLCESKGIEVIIIDSITHEWEFLLDYHSSLTGNSFTNWAKITPRQNSFIQKIVQSSCHIISTIRTKQEYVLSEKNGKMVPEKVGLKGVQRYDVSYEFSLVFDLDIKNHATASKDRTGLFFGKPEQTLSVSTGSTIKEWCNSGTDESVDEVMQRIGDCKSIKELLSLYTTFPQFKNTLKPEFELRKRQILINQDVEQHLSTIKINENGTTK